MKKEQEDAYEQELRDDMYWDMKRKNNTIFKIAIMAFVVVFILVIAMFVKILCL